MIVKPDDFCCLFIGIFPALSLSLFTVRFYAYAYTT
jgi:hypothetical protein